MPLRPVLCLLHKRLLILLVLVPDSCLHSIIGLRLNEQLASKLQHSFDLGRRFPFVSAKHTQAHAAFVIVGDVGMVDFRLKVERGRFKRVIGGKSEV